MYGTVKAEMVCTQVRSSSYVFLSYGDNVKIYMQMMDLESYKKVKKFFKKTRSPRCKLLRNCI